MAKIFHTITFTGDEEPRDMAQKLSDMQRGFDTRIAALETENADLTDRIEELEE